MNTASSRVRASANRSPGNLRQFLIARISSVVTAMRFSLSRAFGRSADPFDPNCSANLDIDRISARLDIANRARADGKLDQPPPNEELVAGTQKEIIIYFKQLQQKSRNQVADLGDRLRDIREIIDIPEANSQLSDIPSRCENEIRRRIADFHSQLKFLDERERHFESLRQNDALADADDRDLAKRFYHLFMAILIAAGAVVIVNQVVPGMIPPALISTSWAVAITLLFVIVPLLLGALVSHSATGNRYLGGLARFLSISIGLVFVAILALFTAHLITALSAGPIITLNSVKNVMLTAPLAIGTNVIAWTGFGIVALAGLLAFLLGYQATNSRLDLRVAQRSLIRIADEREYRTRQMRKRINAVVDTAETDVSKLLLQLKGQIRQYSQLVETAKRVPASLTAYDIALEDACNILLDRYRTINGRARRTDWPVCFAEHACFRLDTDPDSAIAGDEERHLDKMRRGVAKLEDGIAKIRQQLRDLNWRAINDLTESPAQVTPLSNRDNVADSILPQSESAMPASSVEPLLEHEFQRSSHYA